MARASLALALLVGCAAPRLDEFPAPEAVRLSLLAVGDTGKPPRLGRPFHRARAVGLGLAAEDARRPADALVLLGDNFYWHGLLESELVERVRENVVSPYCRFVDLSGPRSREVAGACLGAQPKHRIPIFAILGNHDYGSADSPHLQRRAIPEFVSNWHMPAGVAALHEFDAGVSLILGDSVALGDGADPEPLLSAIRSSRGPWRILAVHHPLAVARDRHGAFELARYRDRLRGWIEDTGVPVQIVLSGDEHNLQLIEMPAPGPRLQVVSGSGSRVRALSTTNPAVRFALAEPGFARIDVVGPARDDRLVVSLFTTGNIALSGRESPRLVARYSLARDGELVDLLTRQPAVAQTGGPDAHP